MVSIVMTSYNHAQYILDAVKSVVLQRYEDWELVIVDDCSTDASLEAVKGFLLANTKIQGKVKVVSHVKNKGYGSSLREAIEISSGEFVLVLDSDDVLADDRVLSVCVKVHKKYPDVSMTYSNYKVSYEDLKTKSVVVTRQIRDDEFYLKRGGVFAKQARPGDELNVSLKISHLKVFKRKHYDMTEGIDPNLKKTVDKDLVFKLEEVGKLKHINEFLMLYRRHVNSLAAQFGRSNPEEKGVIERARQGIYEKAVMRRRRKGGGLKIFVDGSRRSAVSRMFPYWEKKGCAIVSHSKLADVQLSVVRIYSKTGLPTLLRVNGIYYDRAEDFIGRNYPISESHTQATAIVYQSEVSKLMCEKFLRKRTTSFYNVVYNGVSEANWKKSARPHNGINVFSCAKWRRIKRLPELIAVFQMFLEHCPDSRLHVIGPMGRGAQRIESPNVFYYGELSLAEIKEMYRESDVHVHLCKKDSCPSNIPESIAAGVPVVTTNLCGGATEMCCLSPNCVVINEGKQSLEADFIYKESYNEISLYTKSQVVAGMLDIAKRRKRTKLPQKLTIENTSQEYLQMLEKLHADS